MTVAGVTSNPDQAYTPTVMTRSCASATTAASDIFLVFFFTKPMVTVLARTKFFGQGHPLSGLDAKHLGVTDRPVDQMARGPRPATSGGLP